jgi:excisionase family DNA binding protein
MHLAEMRSYARTEPWMSIQEVAAHVGVGKDSVYRWIEKRGLPARKIGKLWKLKLSEVDAWVGSRRDTSVSSAHGNPSLPRAAAHENRAFAWHESCWRCVHANVGRCARSHDLPRRLLLRHDDEYGAR